MASAPGNLTFVSNDMWGTRLVTSWSSKSSAGVASDVHFRENTLHSEKAVHSGFETQRRRRQKSKTGAQVTPTGHVNVSTKDIKKPFQAMERDSEMHFLGRMRYLAGGSRASADETTDQESHQGKT